MSEGGVRLPLATANGIAEGLRARLAPVCRQIEVVGSVRREVAEVGDIELLVEPAFGRAVPPGQLFELDRCNLFHKTLMERAAADKRIQVVGSALPDSKLVRINILGISIEFWVVPAPEWGVAMMIRTGSGGPDGFGSAMLARWKSVSGGGYSEENRLHLPDKTVVDTPTELSVFEHCGVPWIPPHQRTDGRIVRRRVKERRK